MRYAVKKEVNYWLKKMYLFFSYDYLKCNLWEMSTCFKVH